MNILDKIVKDKQLYVKNQKERYPVKLLEEQPFFQAPTVSLIHYLSRKDSSGIIAEFKRKSPSEGYINQYASVVDVTIGYMQSGAMALSVLTDEKYFGGKDQDLIQVRQSNYCPILRKDFVIDEYQILEARSIGADVILLIASILTPKQIKDYTQLAHSLGMEVLLEVKNQEELENALNEHTQIVGVNNRDLETFKVDVENSIRLSEFIPDGITKISESGISKPEVVLELKKHGFQGFLMGTHFMKHGDPVAACRDFIGKIQVNKTVAAL